MSPRSCEHRAYVSLPPSLKIEGRRFPNSHEREPAAVHFLSGWSVVWGGFAERPGSHALSENDAGAAGLSGRLCPAEFARPDRNGGGPAPEGDGEADGFGLAFH